jgi:hypothetical protein
MKIKFFYCLLISTKQKLRARLKMAIPFLAEPFSGGSGSLAQREPRQ